MLHRFDRSTSFSNARDRLRPFGKARDQDSRVTAGWFGLPQGVRDFPPDAAEEIRKVEESLLEEFGRWGYRRVITPLFESLESISVGLGDDLRDKILKFVDPTTGDVVALRPDITPQIARMVAVQLREYAKPLRLCYNGRLIRFEEKGSGKEREMFQVGCELMGLSSAEADAEIIALAIKSLEKLGIKELVLDIGHTGLLRFLLAKAGDARREVEESLKKKDQESLGEAIRKASIPRTIKETILSLPELYGGREILGKTKNVGTIKKYIKELEGVLSLLDEFELSPQINIDLGELRGFNYYTGVTFELISPHAPSPLVRGGRYDELIGKYGYDSPATGFAVDVESLLGARETHPENGQIHFVVIPKKPSLRREAIRTAEGLRSQGYKVILELRPGLDPGESLKQNHVLSSCRTLLLEAPNRIKLIEPDGSGKEVSGLEELVEGVKSVFIRSQKSE